MFSLTLYRMGDPRARVGAPHRRQGSDTAMKTTPVLRTTANPRRSTLAHLEDAAQLGRPVQPEYAAALPGTTANPRRTVLMTPPAPYVPAYLSAAE